MPKNQHTQKLLDELKAPKHAGRADGEEAILAFLPMLAKLSHQATEGLTLAQMAETAEEDEVLRGRLEVFVTTDRRQREICAEIERLIRDLILCLRQRERYDADTRPLAEAKGYRAEAAPGAPPE